MGNPFQLIELEENLGFAGNCNVGIEACDGDVVLCNDDAVCLSPDWDELFRRQGTTPGLASIGVTSNNILKHQLMGLSGPAWMKTDAISFFFAYLSRDAIETVGLLDEAFGPGPNDDLDWCFRARKLDYEHYVDRRILVWHFRNGSQTLGKLCPDSSAQEKLTRRLLLRKHPEFASRLLSS
jgi:GT2 family glycosyltransferase